MRTRLRRARSSSVRTRDGGRRTPGYFYAASGEPGFRNVIVQIFDLKNPTRAEVRRTILAAGTERRGAAVRGTVRRTIRSSTRHNKRLYIGYRNAGGQIAGFDISDPANQKLLWSLDMKPPFRGPHTVSPIVYDRFRTFGASACRARTPSWWTRREAPPTARRARPDSRRVVHGGHYERDQADAGVSLAGARRRFLQEGRALRAAPARRARSTARSIATRTRSPGSRTSTPACGSSISRIRSASGRSGITCRRPTSDVAPDREGSADGHSDERRRHRSPRPRVRVGSSGTGLFILEYTGNVRRGPSRYVVSGFSRTSRTVPVFTSLRTQLDHRLAGGPAQRPRALRPGKRPTLERCRPHAD